MAVRANMPAMKLLATFVVLITSCDLAAAEVVPLPRPRSAASAPSQQSAAPVEPAEPPSACRLRLTDDLALAPSAPSIDGPGECGGTDLGRLARGGLGHKKRTA